MRTKRNPWWAIALAIAIMVCGLGLIGFLGYKLFSTDNAIYTLTIPLVLSLISLPITKYIETRFEQKNLNYISKKELYSKIFDFFYKVLLPLAKTPSDEAVANVAQELQTLNAEITKNASDAVLLRWIQFNKLLAKKPMAAILVYAEIMHMMRNEIGYRNKNIDSTDLLIPMLGNIDFVKQLAAKEQDSNGQ